VVAKMAMSKNFGILLLVICIVAFVSEPVSAKPVLSKNTISLFPIHPNERNSKLNNRAKNMPVGTIYLDGQVQLRVNWAMLKRPVNNSVGDWNTIALKTLTIKDLTYAWGKANEENGYYSFELLGKHSNGKEPGNYFVDVKCADNRVSEYRIRRESIMDTSWLKVK